MKPGRPFGLSLAILASAMLFSILPLMQVGTILLLRRRFQGTSLNGVNPAAAGGALNGIPDISLIIQVILGIIFLVIAVFAWRGRPAWIRFAMLIAVAILAIVTVILSIVPLVTNPDVNAGIDSGAAISQTLLSWRLISSVLVAFYVVWYVNRGPARAFYRGYYLPDPDETAPTAH